jgi:hypothetical protein
MSDTAAPRLTDALRRLGYEDVRVTCDYAGVERVIEGRWP